MHRRGGASPTGTSAGAQAHASRNGPRRGAVRVLLTEGSSLTAREVVSCLGPRGHHLEVLDPDPFCLARFSRWVRHVHRCPAPASDARGYLDFLCDIASERSVDVVLPTHEQAWLLAAARPALAAGLALAGADAFARVQSKLAFAELLDELDIPQPRWRLVQERADADLLECPFWLKAPFSTAGGGVRHVTSERVRETAVRELLARGGPLIAQQPAAGQYGQVQGLFEHGALVAAHTSVARATGMGGSAAARESVDHPRAREHLARVGAALRWHGGLTLDYVHRDGAPLFIECNPRMVEPANAATSGVDLADLLVRLSAGESLAPDLRLGRSGVRTHGAIGLLMGVAGRREPRRRLLRVLADALLERGPYRGSSERQTPVFRDPPSALPLAYLLARLLVNPGSAEQIAAATVARYSISPASVASVARPAS